MKEDKLVRACARCGQSVNRLKDSFKSMPDGSVIHASCPTSEAMKSVPAIRSTPSTPLRSSEGPDRQFIRMEDAAKMLSVSVDTVRRRIRSGELPAKRLRGASDGGRQTILIDQADVLALLEPYTGAEA